MGEPAILVEGLTKSFGRVHALRGIDLAVPQGTVLGVLGPNGAGKTTAVRILTTLLTPDGGRAVIEGYDVVREPARVRRLIGLAGQSAAVQEELTGRENLEIIGRFYRLGGPVPGPGPSNCWTSSVSSTPRIGPRRPSRAGWRVAWTWRPAWSADRRYCSSTSRPAGSTRGAGWACGR